MAKLPGPRRFGCSISTSSINVSDAASDNVLEVRNLVTAFDTDAGQLTAVDGVSFDVRRGRTLGIAGESGCGKSVTCHEHHAVAAAADGEDSSGQRAV